MDFVVDEAAWITVCGILRITKSIASGLRQYCFAVETISRIKHLERSFSQLRRELEAEGDTLLNSVKLLLKECMNDQDLGELLEDVQNVHQWQLLEVDGALRTRLGRSYREFQSSVMDMKGALSELQDSLLIDDHGNAPFVDEGRSIKEHLAELKFGLKMRPYFNFLEVAKRKNAVVQAMSCQTHLPRLVAARRIAPPNYDTARAYALNVYSMLNDVFSRTCAAGHRVSLFLGPERGVKGGKARYSSRATASRVVLHHKISGAGAKLPWLVEEAELRMECAEQGQDEGHVFTSVRGRAGSSEVQEHQAEAVVDLCTSLQIWRSTQLGSPARLGYLSSACGDRRHGLYWPLDSVVDHASTTETTLAGILSAQHGRPLSLLDRRRLALSLANGTLHLYDTPWLCKQWGKHEIVLFTERGRLATSGPFVSVDKACPEPRAKYFEYCRAIKNETIFALGIVLIELALKKPFEELKLPEDADEGPWHADLNAAIRLTQEVEYEAGARYADVVRRCVWCEFDHGEIRLDDQKLQAKIYSGVIAKLEEEVENLER